MLPPDHDARLDRARLALDGLSVGDAFGQRFFVRTLSLAEELIAERAIPRAPWEYTDDTEMALAVFDVLALRGAVDPDLLAVAFARRYARDPRRGYGGGAHGILSAIVAGEPWRDVSRAAFDGMGSLGNGGAMRVAPVGAYFMDDLDAVVAHARASAEVTHAHPEGQAGAIAIAVGTAAAGGGARGRAILEAALERTPDGETRAGIATALGLPGDASVQLAASALGTGWRVTSQDTVPFALWCAARHADDFEAAMWTTVAGLGDRDTTCAIVGGIVALSAGRASIPGEWLASREALWHDDGLAAATAAP